MYPQMLRQSIRILFPSFYFYRSSFYFFLFGIISFNLTMMMVFLFFSIQYSKSEFSGIVFPNIFSFSLKILLKVCFSPSKYFLELQVKTYYFTDFFGIIFESSIFLVWKSATKNIYLAVCLYLVMNVCIWRTDVMFRKYLRNNYIKNTSTFNHLSAWCLFIFIFLCFTMIGTLSHSHNINSIFYRSAKFTKLVQVTIYQKMKVRILVDCHPMNVCAMSANRCYENYSKV